MPQGLGVHIEVVAVVLGATATIVVALRLWVRLRNGAIGKDDYFMVIAFALFITCCILTHIACLSGLGANDDIIMRYDPSRLAYENALKYFFLFQCFYMFCVPFIKASVCTALLRITRQKRFVVPVWGIIFLSTFTGIFGFTSVMGACKPIAANWDLDYAACNGATEFGVMSIVVAVSSILTDWLCAILPAIMLWNLNMKLKVKVWLIFVLALGSLASVSTCIRLPYIHVYKHIYVHPDNGLQKGGSLVMWSVVECGIGVIAGSLPPLQPLLRRLTLGTETSRRMKLTYFNNRHDHQPEASPSISRCNYRQFPPATPPPAVLPPTPPSKPIRMQNMGPSSRGNTLVTTCEAGYCPWTGNNSKSDETSSQRLVIVKNTRIDIEYNPVRPKSGLGNTPEIV
ncbi:hypothetical protein F5B19DRAFT_492045 [Rostrohypoxylon terebratum]|nr:hypothetical protein F5B19DRAFT_492045 [Rostrohypoxylon terebratum]